LAVALIQPVLDRFCDVLACVAAARPDPEPMCTDLQHRLGRFLEPPEEIDDSPGRSGDDDFPF
jgi:hypothetical protein